ncbi:glycoside hydrolase family 65 protein [Lactiplantibacillus carotarum]|uniref:glycoside hydrolase family 65 protein n=1 Tax=Lactiplantibacillus carotarum TaxID=2993456 RepID=UPI00298EEAB8|nr:glycosyl hydrolase family 65 protein [Lactiplantibacillus carotarum]
MKTTKLTLNDVATRDRQYLETIFALGDGHFGVRDSLPFTGSQRGTLPVMLVNGFYATNPITYGESAVGYAKAHQTIISLTTPKYLDIMTSTSSSEEPDAWQLKLVTTDLDFESGQLTEVFEVVVEQQTRFNLTIESQMVLDGSHQFVVTYHLTSLDYTGQLGIKRPLLQQKVSTTDVDSDDPRIAHRASELSETRLSTDEPGAFCWTTTSMTTEQTITQRDEVKTCPTNMTIFKNESGFIGEGKIVAGETLTWQFVRAVSEINQPLPAVNLNDYQAANQRILTDFWHQSQVEISDDKLQVGIQYNLFQLFQSAGRNGTTNIAAKGITGPGYEGHYFWDTEMYMLPFFIYTQPEIAKQLLNYRYSIIEQAKQRARELGVKTGALFAWRTINGEEASAYYPAGTAQYHINADIAHAVKLYYDVTGDTEFLRHQGAEIVLETAKFWFAFGSYRQRDGREEFCLFKVTGPDEYTALVDNNYYTNRMAKENLAFAAWLIEHDFIKVNDVEMATAFKDASERMYLPYDEEQRITKQDDDSPEMPVWPFEETPRSNYPLLLHYHPLMIYRYQVNKQADTLLAEMLFPTDQTPAQTQRDFDFYEKITTHDSSLSRSIFSILASRLDLREKAFNYYMDTALMDLIDLQGNAQDGLHEANLGGSWLGLTYGFSGLFVKNEHLHVSNHLPAQLQYLNYRLRFHGRVLEVQLTQESVRVVLISGVPLTVVINGVSEKIS